MGGKILRIGKTVLENSGHCLPGTNPVFIRQIRVILCMERIKGAELERGSPIEQFARFFPEQRFIAITSCNHWDIHVAAIKKRAFAEDPDSACAVVQ